MAAFIGGAVFGAAMMFVVFWIAEREYQRRHGGMLDFTVTRIARQGITLEKTSRK